VADAKFTNGVELDHVAAIRVHHPAEFADDGLEEAIEIDLGVNGGREAVDDRLARLVHLRSAFE
jgi:hypothetical protein